MHALTLQDLLLLISDNSLSKNDSKPAKSITPLVIQGQNLAEQSATLTQKSTKKRIGLMPIDKRVYELLDTPSEEFFQ